MSDKHIAELKGIYYATGSHGDEAAWIAARIKAGEEIPREGLAIGHICGHIAYSIVLDEPPIEGEISIWDFLDALDAISREAVIRGYLAIIVDWAEKQEEIDSAVREAILNIIRLFATNRADWATPEISDEFDGLLLNLVASLGELLPPQSEPYEEHIATYSSHDMLSSLLYGVSQQNLRRLASGIYSGQSGLFAGIERQDTEHAPLSLRSKAVMRRALEPWALGLRDPLDSIVERLEQLWS